MFKCFGMFLKFKLMMFVLRNYASLLHCNYLGLCTCDPYVYKRKIDNDPLFGCFVFCGLNSRV